MPFDVEYFDIKDLILVKPRVFFDNRGYFLETYKRSDFKKIGICDDFVQDNYSLSKKGVIRGLHFQIGPKGQGKLVSVKKGKIIDVAVDVRKESATFGKYVMAELSSDNHYMLWIPEGFAHGFVSLEENTVVAYKCTNEYSKEHERGIIYNDPDIGIDWNIKNPIVSEKDLELKRLEDCL
jgi:dTDP-4-dehydrorhamnose 3,5-epimerase